MTLSLALIVACALVALALVCNAFMDSLAHSYVGNLGWRLAGYPDASRLSENPSWWGHARHVWLRRYNRGPDGEPRDPKYGLRSYMKNPVTAALVTPFHDAWHFFKLLHYGLLLTAVAVASPEVPWWAGLAAWPVLGLWWEAWYALFKAERFLMP